MLNTPVAAADLGERIGGVSDIVVEPQEHRLIAFVVREGNFFTASKFLSPEDIIEYDPQALIIASADAIVPFTEIVRARTLMKQRAHVLKRKVVTEAGERIGTVINYAIDTDTSCIVRYYVRSLFGQDRIIPTTSIVSVTKDSFVVAEDKKPAQQRSHGVPKISEG